MDDTPIECTTTPSLSVSIHSGDDEGVIILEYHGMDHGKGVTVLP
jgi:hypothetical protein